MARMTSARSKIKSQTQTHQGIEEKIGDFSTLDVAVNPPQTSTAFNNLNLPTFNPENYLAPNLFTDSSPLPQTPRVEADRALQSIQQKRETLRVIGGNLQLNTDALKVGSLSEKMTQSGIDYQTAKIGTEIKMVGFESQRVSLALASSKLSQISERLNHENVTLEGLKRETDQRRRFWEEKYQLGESRITQVQLAKYQLDAKIGAIEAEGEIIE